MVVQAEIPRELVWCHITEREEDDFVAFTSEYEKLSYKPEDRKMIAERR